MVRSNVDNNTSVLCYKFSGILGLILICSISLSCNDNRLSGVRLTFSKRLIPANAWKAPDSSTIPRGKTGDMIRYGKELLTHTAKYFGPKGSIAPISNGMNCQNCHLAGGSRLFANNYSGVLANYPKMNYRNGKIQPLSGRISDCFSRSLAGEVPDTNGKEVRAIMAYINWVGQGVKKGKKLFGSATEKLTFLETPADPQKGKVVFVSKCKVCHGVNGEGMLAADKLSYTYPPLWGDHSYNNGAGMYRIGTLAGFVKNNMPFGATYKSPRLMDEEAWNVAAFINSQPRPHYDQRKDWKDLKSKPIDFPFGPYADNFSEMQHKYGPFKPIAAIKSN
ncbi:c-type cytochrome [Mucilaginibacter sp.]|uniref:c-type cytochrome n=1 Tax=Mucilaginibacter sp. TaxID=1882438 RepID=UPI00284005F3|nr:c-type cytochrome [Mucilaginibacter sp.]MDR3693296.1 c-type cytochrome [Mucilaginibacter sp.]